MKLLTTALQLLAFATLRFSAAFQIPSLGKALFTSGDKPIQRSSSSSSSSRKWPRQSGAPQTVQVENRLASSSVYLHTNLYSFSHHHHHHHDHGESLEHAEGPPKNRIRNWSLSLLISAAFTLGPRLLLQRQSLQARHWLSLTMSFLTFTSARKIRSGFTDFFNKFRGLRQAIRNHSRLGQKKLQMQSLYDQKTTQNDDSTAEADRVTWIGVVVNLLLSVGKLVVGVKQHSSALVADAGHSLSDLFSDFITLWSIQIARLPPDADHPDGHYKFEAIGSLFLSLTLLATGSSIGAMASKELFKLLAVGWGPNIVTNIQLPGPLALVMAATSIASKEWLYRITKRVGEKMNSPVVIANAWHHRSDAYSSILALLSIAWAMTGFVMADSAAGLMVAGMICMTGGDILVESIQQLSDSTHEGLQLELKNLVTGLVDHDDDVLGIADLRARRVGSTAVVDITLETSPNLSTTAARAVEERIKRQVVKQLASQSGHSVTANVRAGPEFVVCPLLEAVTSRNGEASQEQDSASRIEVLTRELANRLGTKDKRYAVESVKVHYIVPNVPTVDVTIRPYTESDPQSLLELQAAANELQLALEQTSDIHAANVYLALATKNS